MTDKNGNATVYTYDGNGNIVKTTDAMGTEVLFEYNANDQLVKMTQNRVDEYHEQSETLVTVYEYDGRNLVTRVVQTTGSEELYVYDGNGNMVSKTDGDGYVTEYTYNSLDLVSHINYNGAKEVSYQYNAVGELVRMDDWLGTTTFELDLLNQLTRVTDHKGNVVEYTYDEVGNQTSVTYPDETTVTRTYDALGQLLKVTDAENEQYTYTYDDAGNVTKLVYPNGWIENYTYDAEGNLLKTVDTDPFHNNKVSTKYEYQYDAEGNLIYEYKRDTTAGNAALTTTYGYDALNRIVSAHEVGVGINTTRTYQYDSLGNLIRQEQDGCVEFLYSGAHLDESKECGVIPGVIGTCRWEYTYDGRGNLISEDKYTRTTTGMDWQNVATYVYDETNRMVDGRNEQGERSLYTYNGLGVRVGRELIMQDNTHGYTDFHSETPSVDAGITRAEVAVESYVIDYTSATFVPLTMDEAGGFSYRYVYGLDKLSVKITSEGTTWWGQNTTINILKDYYHQDRMGSTTNMTDVYGRVVGRADYNEWGQITYREALSITSSYRRIWPQLSYTGHDWDDVLGMYYAKARFYSADDKRFVAMDPVKGSVTDPMSLVPYIYCVDNPLRWVDPLGLVSIPELNHIGKALAFNMMTNRDAFVKIMFSGENLWLAGHQLAQAFTYKWLIQYGYQAVELEHTFSATGQRADVIALQWGNLVIYELKHRQAPNLDLNKRGQYNDRANQTLSRVLQTLKEGRRQLRDYYSALRCALENSENSYTTYQGYPYVLMGQTRYKLFEYMSKYGPREVYINLRAAYGDGVIEYWFASQRKGQPEHQYEVDPVSVLSWYKEEESNKARMRPVYQALETYAVGLTVTVGLLVGGVVVGLVLKNLPALAASWIVSAPDTISAVVEKGKEIVWQFGHAIQQSFESWEATAPAFISG